MVKNPIHTTLSMGMGVLKCLIGKLFRMVEFHIFRIVEHHTKTKTTKLFNKFNVTILIELYEYLKLMGSSHENFTTENYPLYVLIAQWFCALVKPKLPVVTVQFYFTHL